MIVSVGVVHCERWAVRNGLIYFQADTVQGSQRIYVCFALYYISVHSKTAP